MAYISYIFYASIIPYNRLKSIIMDFFDRFVMKFTTFFQNYRISCLVQLLRIMFHKMLHFSLQFL